MLILIAWFLKNIMFHFFAQNLRELKSYLLFMELYSSDKMYVNQKVIYPLMQKYFYTAALTKLLD